MARVQLRVEVARAPVVPEVARKEIVAKAVPREQEPVAWYYAGPLLAAAERALHAHAVVDPP